MCCRPETGDWLPCKGPGKPFGHSSAGHVLKHIFVVFGDSIQKISHWSYEIKL